MATNGTIVIWAFPSPPPQLSVPVVPAADAVPAGHGGEVVYAGPAEGLAGAVDRFAAGRALVTGDVPAEGLPDAWKVMTVATPEQAVAALVQRFPPASGTSGTSGAGNPPRLDPLTGLPGRDGMPEEGQEVTGVVVIMDLDGLKQVNDEQGHEAGDAYIRSAADACREVAGNLNGQAARWGGDEFVLLLPPETAGAEEALLEALRQHGARGTVGTASGAGPFGELLAEADRQLLAKKKARPKDQAGPRKATERIATSTRPVVIMVAGCASGVGVTTVACGIAGYLARRGLKTALVETGEPSLSLLSGLSREGAEWTANLAVFQRFPGEGPASPRDVAASRKYAYIVVDGGTEWSREIGADLRILVTPADAHRLSRVTSWLATQDAKPDLAVSLGQPAKPIRQAVGARMVHLARHGHDWPPGSVMPDKGLDDALGKILADVLPDKCAPVHRYYRRLWAFRIGLWFAVFASGIGIFSVLFH